MSSSSCFPQPLPTQSFPTKSSSHQRQQQLRVPQSGPKADSLHSTASSAANPSQTDAALLALLRRRKTDEAYAAYSVCPCLPGPTCLSRLVAQLSYQSTSTSLSRAQAIVRRLRDEGQLNRLDANALGLLASATARAGSTLYGLSLLRTMLRSGYLPHVKAWSAVAARLAAEPDDGPAEALRLFSAVVKRIRAVGSDLASSSKPDTGAFNAVLNACANLGDVRRFAQLFDEMTEFGAKPDVLTYNIVIKLCARAERRDLLVSVLERIIREDVKPCVTTMHSLVAAYVGFGDLRTAEEIVQAMREGRNDIPRILRETAEKNRDVTGQNEEDLADEEEIDPNGENEILEEDREVHVLLEKLAGWDKEGHGCDPPPLLPKTYTPDSRIYTTLMKGYMKAGRVDDVVRMTEAMRREDNPLSRPDEVTYTTVITTLVNAGAVDRARAVLAEMTRAGVPANRVTYNVLLKGYCQQLQMDKAKELAREMVGTRGVEPNVVSYNILIDGCIFVDDSAGALAYFNEMRERGIAPSKVSYTTLMKAFALAGQPKLAHKVFDEMIKDPRVKVDRVAWNMLIEGYCRLGLVEEAKKLVEQMKESGLLPDVATYGSLANGIALARKPGEALLLWNEVKERCKQGGSSSLKPDEGLLGTLADVCVKSAFFQKALEIVACMEENGIAPNKTKYRRMYVEMHSRMFTSKHASQARQDRRREKKRAAEAFKFWLGLPNSYYGSEWRLDSIEGDEDNEE